jgi:hypothetical protein
MTPQSDVPRPSSKRLFRVYIDESGDRGWSPNSSRYFVFAAVIVEDTNERDVLVAREQLRTDLGKPKGHVLHWSPNIDKHDARKFAAKVVGSLPIQLVYVIVDKESLRNNSSSLNNHAKLHNYAARRLIERVSWLVRDEGGEAIITFKYSPFHSYLEYLKSDSDCSIAWQAIRGDVRVDSPERLLILQIADICAGALMAAILPDQFGGVESAYLDEIQSSIYRRPPGPITTYGLHVISLSQPTFLSSLPWWPNFPK